MHPETFTMKFSPIHKKVLEVLEDEEHCKKLIIAPRGIGKTSLVCAWIERMILYRECKVVLYISHSEQLAVMQTENIKFNLTSPTVRAVFGDVTVSDNDNDIDQTFSKKSWVAFGSTIVIPRGCLQQVRGIRWRQWRPDVIVFDDLEDKQEVQSETNREGIRRWFYSDPLYADSLVGNEEQPTRFVYIDTLKHPDALPLYLEKGGWHTTYLSICDENLHSLAPEFITDEELAEERAAAAATGTLEEWYLERLNSTNVEETKRFRREYFKYYTDEDINNCHDLECAILVDPARVIKNTTDYTAIVGVGVSAKNRRIYVMDIVSDRMYPDQMYDEIFSMARRLGASVIGVEDAGLGSFVTYPLENEMRRRGINCQLVVLHTGLRKKEDRIGALLPFYRMGIVYHNPSICQQLEQQLLSFPRGRYDDIADAFAYLPKILHEGERFFIGDSEPTISRRSVDAKKLMPALTTSWEVI